MIRYDLACATGHEFDSWFRDSAAYDDQAARGDITCPACGSSEVSKRLMTPGLPVKANRRAPAGPLTEPSAQAVREALRRLRREVEANADYVGDEFPAEARRIYYKETEARGIYGEASLEDAKSLREEGIEVFPLPPAPDDKN